jgi:nucleolar protein 15
MKKYFSQFGRVNRLRLSRNKKTGASKHFAFVEFASTEVADIVARTMDNYLLFGHILKCKLVPTEQVHPDLFKGAGQRFKVDPRNKKAGLEMERGVTREQWEKRIERENRRRSSKSAVLKEEFGYEYDAPNVKSVDEVPKQTNIVENGEPQQLLDDAPADVPGNTPDEEAPVEEHSKVKNKKKATKTNGEASSGETSRPAPEKKSKKVAKAKAAVEATVPLEAGADVVEPASETKSKKNKKRKSDVAVESVTADEVPVAAEVAPKTKKAKKVTKSSPAHENAPEKKRKVKAEPEATSKKAKKAKA